MSCREVFTLKFLRQESCRRFTRAIVHKSPLHCPGSMSVATPSVCFLPLHFEISVALLSLIIRCRCT